MKYFTTLFFFVIVYTEFEDLLEEQAPIDSYVEWLDSMIDRCVVKVSIISSFRCLIESLYDDCVIYDDYI